MTINDDRTPLLMAHWSLTFDCHRGVLCCLDNQFYGPAFALLRTVLESTIRAHVALMGDAVTIEKLKKDEYQTNFKTVGPEIDKFFGLDDLMEKFLGQARLLLHSYTHAGLAQISRRFTGKDLQANYSDAQIDELIRISTSASFMVNKSRHKTLRMAKGVGGEQ